MNFSSWPIIAKITSGLACLVILFYIEKHLFPELILSALALWGLAGLALAYSGGLYPGAVTLPVLGSAVRKLSVPPALPERTDVPPSPAAPRPTATLVIEKAQASLNAMEGNHPAVRVILDNIIPLARNQALQGRRLLGAERALIILIHGPTGVGKSMIVAALSDLLVGLNVVASPAVQSVSAPRPNRETDWDEILKPAVDGLLVIDNAGWLAEKSPHEGKLNSDVFLATLGAFADHYPARLCAVVAMTTKQKDEAFSTLYAREVLRRLRVFPLECNGLDDGSLSKIFERFIWKNNLSIDAAAHKSLRDLIRQHRDSHPEGFSHAELVRQIAESVSMWLAQKGETKVSPKDIEIAGDGLHHV